MTEPHVSASPDAAATEGVAPIATAPAVPLVPFADRHAGCGGVYATTTTPKTETMVGLSVTVERRVMRCSKCEHERRAPDQVEGDYLGTMAAIREKHGLLTPAEIRRTREALGVTSDEFDALLGLPSGISKGWETQRHMQNAMADARIRALQDVEYAKGVAVGARVTLRLTDEEKAAFKPPAFLRRKAAAAVSAEGEDDAPSTTEVAVAIASPGSAPADGADATAEA